MKKKSVILLGILLLFISTIPVFAEDSDLASKIDKILSKGPEHDNYHVTAKQVDKWMKAGKTDFQVIDVRMPPDDGPWGRPEF